MNEDGQSLIEGEDNGDVEQALRCISLSPDGQQIACGDWTGNIRIHKVDNLEETQCI